MQCEHITHSKLEKKRCNFITKPFSHYTDSICEVKVLGDVQKRVTMENREFLRCMQ